MNTITGISEWQYSHNYVHLIIDALFEMHLAFAVHKSPSTQFGEPIRKSVFTFQRTKWYNNSMSSKGN